MTKVNAFIYSTVQKQQQLDNSRVIPLVIPTSDAPVPQLSVYIYIYIYIRYTYEWNKNSMIVVFFTLDNFQEFFD